MKKYILLLVILILLMGSISFAIIVAPANSHSVKPCSSCKTPYTMAVENLSAQNGVYTEYYFAPNKDDELQVSIILQRSDTSDNTSQKAKILLFQIGIDDNIDSFTTDNFANKTQHSHTFTGLDPDAYYYLRIDNLSQKSIFQASSLEGEITVQ